MADDQASAKPLVRVDVPAQGHDGVALVTLDRADALNALSFELLRQLVEILQALDDDDRCRAIVVTGAGTKAFAAGGDIKELAVKTPVPLYADDLSPYRDELITLDKPLSTAARAHPLRGG